MLILLLDIVVKATLILAMLSVVDACLRNASAALKHRLWGASFFALLLLPFLTCLLPEWRIAILPNDGWTDSTQNSVTLASPLDAPNIHRASIDGTTLPLLEQQTSSNSSEYLETPEQTAMATSPSFLPRESEASIDPSEAVSKLPSQAGSGSTYFVVLGLAGLWMLGLVYSAWPLCSGITSLHRLRRRSEAICDDGMISMFEETCQTIGLKRRVELRQLDHCMVPMTWGIVHPIVIVPTEFAHWSAESRRMVLLHELAHVKRWDVLYQFIARLGCSFYWFHPMVWYALRRLRVERELACDDCVVALCERPSVYANQIVDIAIRFQHAAFPTAVAMAQKAGLEHRIRCMLDRARSHLPITKTIERTILFGMVGIACFLAAIRLDAMAKTIGTNNGEASTGEPEIEATPLEPMPTADAEDTKPAAKADSAQGKATQSPTVLYRGKVLTPDGKPADLCELRLVYYRGAFPHDSSVPPVALTKGDGTFEFTIRKSDYSSTDGDNWASTSIAASKLGFGIGISPSVFFDVNGEAQKKMSPLSETFMKVFAKTRKAEIQLALDDMPLQGKVISPEGTPIAGVRLRVIELWEVKDSNVKAWDRAAAKPNADYFTLRSTTTIVANGQQLPAAIPDAITNEQGEFEMKGIGRNRVVNLIASGPTTQQSNFFARTFDGNDVVVPFQSGSQAGMAMPKTTFHPRKFTLVGVPSKPVRGKIIDAETSKPIANMMASAGRSGLMFKYGNVHIHSVSDDQGLFALEGVNNEDANDVYYIAPPRGSEYMPVGFRASTSNNSDQPKVIKLKKGTMIRGKVTDGRTGSPIMGSVLYFARRDTEGLKNFPGFGACSVHECRTDDDGNYLISTIPGKGYLAFLAYAHQEYKKVAEAPPMGTPIASPESLFIEAVPSFLVKTNYHSIHEIDVVDGQGQSIDLQLNAGAALKGTIVDGDGKPLSGVLVNGLAGRGSSAFPLPGDEFVVEGYFSDSKRELYFHPETGLAAELELQGEQTKPLVVSLHPSTTLIGKLVNKDRAPIANVRIQGEGIIDWKSYENSEKQRSDDNGRFEILGLIPGNSYTIFGFNENQRVTITDKVKITEGPVQDLGDVEVASN